MRLLGAALAAMIFYAPASAGEVIRPGVRVEAPKPPIQPARNPVIDLQTIKGEHICTGFYIGHGLVVTASHCVHDDMNAAYKMVFRDGSFELGRLAMIADLYQGFDDFAVLRFNEDGTKPIRPMMLDCRVPEIGAPVFMEGYPGDMGWTRVYGRVSHEVRPWSHWDQGVYGVNISSLGGFSGSPIMGMDGTVVGILVGSDPGDRTLAVAVPMPRLCTMLGVA